MIDPKDLRDYLADKLNRSRGKIALDRETVLDCYSIARYLVERWVDRVAERDPKDLEDHSLKYGW